MAGAVCSAWGDGRIYHDWKRHWPSNPALKTSSYLALKRERKREVFLCMERVACYRGGIMSWLLGEAGCQARKAKHLFWKSKLQVSHLHMDVLHPPLLLQPLSLPCLSSQRSWEEEEPWSQPSWWPCLPQDTVSLCHLLMAKLLAEEGEAGGWFPLPKLVAVLPCWEALASSVSHTSARSLFLRVSKVLCEKPKHLLCELRSLRELGREAPPGLV